MGAARFDRTPVSSQIRHRVSIWLHADVQGNFVGRTYTLKRRAEKQEQTRRRIVEAAVALHGSLGPAQTTFSMVAERAGVQRHTLYAHFPDEWSLLLACSALHIERSPPPDAAGWRIIGDPSERLRVGLAAVYGWFEENAGLAGCVLRDAESHAPTRDIVALRLGPYFGAYHDTLGAGLDPTQRALLHLSLNFFAWRALVSEAGLGSGEAVAAMARAIESAGQGVIPGRER
jgi:AcrR family transcriptional regulator